jgi:molybdate transport system substrate-binding protein
VAADQASPSNISGQNKKWQTPRALAAAVCVPRAGNSETPSAGAEKPIVVFAAASMKTALNAIAVVWKANRGKAASLVYASSGVLAKQIEQGAPADVANLIRAGTRRNLVGNKLVLIEPSDAGAKIEIAKGLRERSPSVLSTHALAAFTQRKR